MCGFGAVLGLGDLEVVGLLFLEELGVGGSLGREFDGLEPAFLVLAKEHF